MMQGVSDLRVPYLTTVAKRPSLVTLPKPSEAADSVNLKGLVAEVVTAALDTQDVSKQAEKANEDFQAG